jgi:hypothetical protein
VSPNKKSVHGWLLYYHVNAAEATNEDFIHPPLASSEPKPAILIFFYRRVMKAIGILPIAMSLLIPYFS